MIGIFDIQTSWQIIQLVKKEKKKKKKKRQHTMYSSCKSRKLQYYVNFSAHLSSQEVTKFTAASCK